MEKLYKDDVNISMLTAQMEILQVLLKDGDYLCCDEIIAKIKGRVTQPRTENDKRSKLILVNPATSAAGQGSFSATRRLKT